MPENSLYRNSHRSALPKGCTRALRPCSPPQATDRKAQPENQASLIWLKLNTTPLQVQCSKVQERKLQFSMRTPSQRQFLKVQSLYSTSRSTVAGVQGVKDLSLEVFLGHQDGLPFFRMACFAAR